MTTMHPEFHSLLLGSFVYSEEVTAVALDPQYQHLWLTRSMGGATLLLP